ncbi:MAG TPA: ATP-binding protein [Hyphomicrobium sp.]|nr:ATP-binding protein [Hyphomicrobium sp.]
MLGRLGFTGRVLAIVLLALLALMAVGTGLAYVARVRGAVDATPMLLPQRAAAIVEVLESTPPERRRSALEALSSDTLKVSYRDHAPPPDPNVQRLPAIERVFAREFVEVGGRNVVVLLAPEGVPRWRQLHLGQYWLASREPLKVAIGLSTGGYAVLESRGEIGPRVWGMPAGFTIGALGALVGLAAIVAIMREGRPLRRLAGSVARFADRAVPDPVEPAGAPEMRRLIGAVNEMQERIAGLVKGRTILLGAISHDVKTFLTRLRLRVETIPDAEQRARAVRDLDDMTALVEDAIALARGAAVSERRENVDLAALLREEIGNRAGACLTEISLGPVILRGDAVALRRLFANLVDNALRYGTHAAVTVERAPSAVAVLVDDDGPGIPALERAAVFEPFYRIEGSRSRATGGAGLGLAIARAIAEAHGGKIGAEAAPSGGARIRVLLPMVEV